MSHDYKATFSPTQLPLDQIVAKLADVFARSGVQFLGEVHPLRSQDGMATIAAPAPVAVASLADVPSAAKRWWGLSLLCRWGSKHELDVSLFGGTAGDHHLVLTEGRLAFAERCNDPAVRGRLVGLMTTLAQELGCSVAFYDQEFLDGFISPAPDMAKAILKSGQFPSGGNEGVLIASLELLALPDAKKLAAKPQFLGVSTTGYLVYNALTP